MFVPSHPQAFCPEHSAVAGRSSLVARQRAAVNAIVSPRSPNNYAQQLLLVCSLAVHVRRVVSRTTTLSLGHCCGPASPASPACQHHIRLPAMSVPGHVIKLPGILSCSAAPSCTMKPTTWEKHPTLTIPRSQPQIPAAVPGFRPHIHLAPCARYCEEFSYIAMIASPQFLFSSDT
jgi:hypothetical protein